MDRLHRMKSPAMGAPAGHNRFECLQKEAAPVSRGLWGMIQNSSTCPISKRKRADGGTVSMKEASCLSFNHDVSVGAMRGLGGPSPSESGISTGSGTSLGATFLSAIEGEAFPTDLGLGLNVSNSQGSADGCFTSMVSGGRPVVTSVDSDVHLLDDLSQCQGMRHDFPPRSGISARNMAGNKENCMTKNNLDAGRVGSRIDDMEMQLQLGLSSGSTRMADGDYNSCVPFNSRHDGTYQEAGHENVAGGSIPIVDEGSTSARSVKAGGYLPSLLMGRRLDYLSPSADLSREGQRPAKRNEPMFQTCTAELGIALSNKESANFRTSSSTMSPSARCAGWERSTKLCKFKGCGKGPRGASGLCIVHGGGRRCQRQGCNKGAEGSTVYCKSHGGGRRCQSLGCTRSAEGKTEYCIAHGGGRRCCHDGCTKAARGRSGRCIRHGGGKRCQKEGCTKSAEGYSGLCISHGGGRRCQFEGCKKGAQGSTMFCKAHGGGKRCMIQGCNKGAEGSTPLCKGHGGGKRCLFEGGGICTKSVHGGTSFCVAHGGGKRCAVAECAKSARGRTDFCVRHGGGKRCKVKNCTKSAQGSTDFCKAHGGGKRCSWGHDGSPYSKFVTDKTGNLVNGPCERFARGKLGLCAAHCALAQDRRIHGGGLIGSSPSTTGIGPGLFRGIVEGSIHSGSHFEPTDAASQHSMHANSDRGDLGSDCGRSDSCVQVCRSTSEPSGLDCESAHASELAPYAGLTHGGSSLNILEKERLPSDRVNQDSILQSSYGTRALWQGLSISAQSNSNHATGLRSGALGHDATGIHAIAPQATLQDLGCLRTLLPPQVLVPLSLQRGDSIRPGQGVHHIETLRGSCDGMVMPSLCLPEQRVHGGNAMALMARSKPSSETPMYR